MTGTNRLSSALCSLAMLGIGASVTGCGGFGPGDYRIWDVAVAPESKSAGCYPNSTPGIDSHSSDAVSQQTWVLTAGPNSELFLDTKVLGLSGKKTDTGFEFITNQTDVTYDGGQSSGSRRTDKQVIDITMTVDGKSISGSVTNKTTHSCTGGTTCGNQIPTCVITNDFNGAEINDVKLEHDPAK